MAILFVDESEIRTQQVMVVKNDYHLMMELVECCTLVMTEGIGNATVLLVRLGMSNIDVVVVVVVMDLQKMMVVEGNDDNLVLEPELLV